MGAIADPPNVHPGPQSNVFERGKCLDFALVVIVFDIFSHSYSPRLSEAIKDLPIINKRKKGSPV
jgi:hypothetical protein